MGLDDITRPLRCGVDPATAGLSLPTPPDPQGCANRYHPRLPKSRILPMQCRRRTLCRPYRNVH